MQPRRSLSSDCCPRAVSCCWNWVRVPVAIPHVIPATNGWFWWIIPPPNSSRHSRSWENPGDIVYVAADAYRLPFVEGLFDGATMIRTLHHMADPSLALAQVTFCACSRMRFSSWNMPTNIISRRSFAIWMRKQDWSPFTEDAVEFARLNFDFHPRAIQKWLGENHFFIEKQLTVSHFRTGLSEKDDFPRSSWPDWMDFFNPPGHYSS